METGNVYLFYEGRCADEYTYQVPQDDLRGALVVLLRHGLDFGVLEELRVAGLGPGPVGRAEGAVGGHEDVPRLAELDHVFLVQVRMAFNLYS